MDRWDKKPWVNPAVLDDLTSGLGLRMTARRQGLARSSMTEKSRKMARHCRALHRNMLTRVTRGNVFMLDEAVTYEEDRGTNHVGLAVLIHLGSYMVLGARAESMAPQGRMTEARRKKLQQLEESRGKRRDQTRRSLVSVLLAMVETMRHRDAVPDAIQVRCDRKSTYPKYIDLVVTRRMPGTRVNKLTFKGDRDPRDWKNPLFRINHTLARIRDRFSRLRRKSWLVSKQRRYLNLMISLWICARNYVRPWKNGQQESPAERAGAINRRISWRECLGWRQDWGVERSPHVLAKRW